MAFSLCFWSESPVCEHNGLVTSHFDQQPFDAPARVDTVDTKQVVRAEENGPAVVPGEWGRRAIHR